MYIIFHLKYGLNYNENNFNDYYFTQSKQNHRIKADIKFDIKLE